MGNPGTELFRLEKYPFYFLNRIVAQFKRLITSLLRRQGLELPYWRVLLVLGERSPRSVGALADTTLIPVSTMMRIVQRMKREGLVSFQRGRLDKRITDVALTAGGRRKLATARKAVAPFYAALMAEFTAREFDALLRLLGRLEDGLDAASKIKGKHS